MRLLRAHSTSRLISLAPAALDCLEHGEPAGEGYITVGTSRDGSLAWLCRGPSLEVFSTWSGARVSAWTFGAALRDQDTCITATAELNYEGSLQLLVATRTASNTTGLLCVLDVQRSIIVKAIELPYKVTAVECVMGAGADQAMGGLVGERLQNFCGIVAVGTAMGHVYLVDLCLDNEDDSSDEIRPNSVLFLDERVHMATLRFNAMAKRKHLCLELDEESNNRGYFYFRKADFSIMKTFAADDVFVSHIAFIKQTGSLAIGFSFGCFQLWKLSDLTLEYSSRMEDDLAPVLNFAYQEPENDPRSFCYLWAARGPLPQDAIEDYCSHLQLFQLGYNRRVWQDGMGYVYQDLTSVCCRFEHELTSNPYIGTNTDGLGSRLVTCYTLRDPAYKPPDRAEDDSDIFDEGCIGEDLSLCVFVWEASTDDSHSKPTYFLAVFDMNRWYQAQMPFSLRSPGGSQEFCPYFAFSSLEEAAEALSPDNLMTVCIDYRSVSRFQSCILPPPEQHYYPSSLAFDVCCVGEGGLVHSKFLGAQRQLLSDLAAGGPDALVENPSDMYHLCLYAGLLPRNMDIASTNLPAMQKREALLSAALENDMLQFLMTCMSQWATGGDTGSGCSLRFLLEWAWAKVGHIKTAIDKLCESLYDWSGCLLDNQATQMLRHYQTMLAHLDSIFQALGSQALPMTEQGHADLALKQQVVRLIGDHLNAVLWFYTVGLLPEHPETDSLSDGQYAYPAAALAQAYAKRRQEIKSLHSELQGTDLLLIDGLVEHMGAPVRLLLERDAGTGLYPPPSLHTTLLLYLAEDVPTATKQLVVAYLLFDLMHLAPEDQTTVFSSRLKAFSQAFGLTHSQTRLIQGMWLLDHKDFEDSLLFLLDPMVRSELTPWQNTRIIKAFIYQGSHKLALKFYRIRKPPAVTPEDVKLKLTVLLANGLTSEAFEYQQLSRDQLSAEDLLSHLFLGCQQTKMVDALLQLPLSDEEEKHLVEYLKTTHESGAAELLVLYYLQRSRFIEAIRLNSRLKHSSLSDLDPGARDRAATRNAIVDCYHAVLPRVQRRLALEAELAPKRSLLARREVARPLPLSAVIQRSHRATAMSHASLLQAVLDNVRQVKTASQSPPLQRLEEEPRPGPFICTPITPRSKRRVSHVSEVVFPAEQTPHAESSLMDSPRLPAGMSPKKSCLNSPFSSTAAEFVVSSVAKKRMSRFFGAEALSLLQTPPVRRKSPTRSRPPTQPATPQSILKMRHRPESTTTSPVRDTPKSSLVTEPRQLTPPRLPRLTDLIAAETAGSAPGSPSHDMSFGTPKQLRFNMPNLSPEDAAAIPEVEEGGGLAEDAETPEEWETENPLRSVHDRSPTPERSSPKHSPQYDVVKSDSVEEGEEMETSQEIETDHVNNIDHEHVNLEDEAEEDAEAMDTCHQEEPSEEEGTTGEEVASDAEPEIILDDSASEAEPDVIASEADVQETESSEESEEDENECNVRTIPSRTDSVDYHSSIIVKQTIQEVNTVTHSERSFTITQTHMESSRTVSVADSSVDHVRGKSLGVPVVDTESEEEPPVDSHLEPFQGTYTRHLGNQLGSNNLGLHLESKSRTGLPRVDSDLERCSTVVNVDSETANLEDVEHADGIEIDVGKTSDADDNVDSKDMLVAQSSQDAEPGTAQAETGSEVMGSPTEDNIDLKETRVMQSYEANEQDISVAETGSEGGDLEASGPDDVDSQESAGNNIHMAETGSEVTETGSEVIGSKVSEPEAPEAASDLDNMGNEEAASKDSHMASTGSEVIESEVTGSFMISDNDPEAAQIASQEISPSVESEPSSLQMEVSDTEERVEQMDDDQVALVTETETTKALLDDSEMPTDADFHNTTASFLSSYPDPLPDPVRVTRRMSMRLHQAAESKDLASTGPGGDLGNHTKKDLVDAVPQEELTSTASPRRPARRRTTPLKQKPSFKTPPRPSRLSVMPPTPPESGKGSPPKESSVEDITVTSGEQPSMPARSARASPTRRSTRVSPTRRSTRVSTESTDDVKPIKPATPPRRPPRSTSDDAGDGKPVRPTTPTRRSMRVHSEDAAQPTLDKPVTTTKRTTRGARQSESDTAAALVPTIRPQTRRASLSRSMSPSEEPSLSPVDKVASKDKPASPARRTRHSDAHKLEVPRVTRSRKSLSPVNDENGVKDTTPDTTPNVSPAGSPTRTPTRRGKKTPESVTPSRRGKKASAATPRKTPTRHNKKDPEQASPPPSALTAGGEDRQTPTRKSTRGKAATPRKSPARNTRRRQTMDTQEVLAAEATQETKDQAPPVEGPLSEGSFMMNLRGRKSLSRENTPEQAEAAATATEPDDDIGNGFSFAAPDVIDNIEDVKFVDAATDIPSFVFSPPLTRHRKLRQSLSEAPAVAPMPSIIPPLIPEGASTTVPFFIKEKKAAKRAKKALPLESPNSEVLLLPSPPPEELQAAAENQPTRQKVKRSASMTLRPKRYTSQRKPLKLW